MMLCRLALFVLLPLVQGQENSLNEVQKQRSGHGSCALAGICCPGRDSSCVVQKAASNSIVEDLSDVPCYCDHACIVIGDCCTDFKITCGVQDCVVSSWNSWSGCSENCGLGVMTRTRSILVEPRNGGQSCPALVQKRACRGNYCNPRLSHQGRTSADDTAIILPVEFNRRRKMNKTSDITWNLRLRYPKNPARERSKPYCVEFEVIRVTRACKALGNFANLREGIHTCVVCEGLAQRSHLGDWKCSGSETDGGLNLKSFFSLREPTCHGKWKPIRSNSTCNCKSGAQYIFV